MVYGPTQRIERDRTLVIRGQGRTRQTAASTPSPELEQDGQERCPSPRSTFTLPGVGCEWAGQACLSNEQPIYPR
jgi:hypothetical protein